MKLMVCWVVQSEPLYVPVKFQDVPTDSSERLNGDCDYCEYEAVFYFKSS